MPQKAPCRYTHGFIASGECPWCHEPVVDGKLRSEVPLREVAVLRWNVPAMLAALDADDEARDGVLSELLLHGPGIPDALPVLRKALAHPACRTETVTLSAFHLRGSELTSEQAEGFEQECRTQPDDCALHLLLLGYYSLRSTRSEADRRAWQRQVLWVVEHAPDLAGTGTAPLYLDPATEAAAYERAKQL